jgi:hypothetical protein
MKSSLHSLIYCHLFSVIQLLFQETPSVIISAVHKLYLRPQCNLFIFSLHSLSQHISAVYDPHEVFFCQKLFHCVVYPTCEENINATGCLNTISFQLSLSLSLMLRPTVSRPVCLGIKHPSGACDQIFISVRNTEYVWQLRSWFRGTPSLTRGRVCLLYVQLALASAVFLGS